jgi:hypothetical protein
MPTQQNLYTLSDTTATLISPYGTHSGVDITIQNVNASGYVYVGNENVSTTNYGYRIAPENAISFELPGKDSLYLVSSVDNLNAAVIIIALESQN